MKAKQIYTILSLSIWCLVSFYPINAQDFQWIRGGGSSDSISYDERVIDIATDSERNVYVVSHVGLANLRIDGHIKTSWDTYPYPSDIQLSSFTCDGAYRWSKIIGGYDSERVQSVAVDSQDNVYVSGVFGPANHANYPSRIDNDIILTTDLEKELFLAKFSKEGVFQWIQRPEPNISAINGGFEMYIDNDIIYWVIYIPTGVYADGAFNNNLAGHNFFVFQYNTSGTFVSATHLQGFQFTGGTRPKFYRNPYNGFFYVKFRRGASSTVTINGTALVSSNALACWDTTGVFQWITTGSDTTAMEGGALYLSAIDFDASNNIYLAGKIVGYNNVNFLGFSMPYSEYTNFVMKLNPTADTIIWNTYHVNSYSAQLMGLQLNGNELGVAAEVRGVNFAWGNLSLPVESGSGGDVLLARFDTQTGTTLSLHSIPSSEGSGESATVVAVDANGDYVIGGGFGEQIEDVHGNTTTSIGGLYDFFVTKFATAACAPLGTNEAPINTSIDIYPNPATKTLSITASKPITSLKMYTVLGQEIACYTTKKGLKTTLDVSKLTAGRYFIKITTNTGVETRTFMKK